MTVSSITSHRERGEVKGVFLIHKTSVKCEARKNAQIRECLCSGLKFKLKAQSNTFWKNVTKNEEKRVEVWLDGVENNLDNEKYSHPKVIKNHCSHK
jgi:hypothetical protein